MTSPGVQLPPSTGVVVVAIDDDRVGTPSMTFTYRNNPNVMSVFPQNTIPSGGIELRFSGEDMDVVQTPVLEITLNDGNITVGGWRMIKEHLPNVTLYSVCAFNLRDFFSYIEFLTLAYPSLFSPSPHRYPFHKPHTEV